MPELETKICEAIDAYHASHPDLMVSEIMAAMDAIYRDLDKALRKHGDTAHIIRLRSRKS